MCASGANVLGAVLLPKLEWLIYDCRFSMCLCVCSDSVLCRRACAVFFLFILHPEVYCQILDSCEVCLLPFFAKMCAWVSRPPVGFRFLCVCVFAWNLFVCPQVQKAGNEHQFRFRSLLHFHCTFCLHQNTQIFYEKRMQTCFATCQTL